MLVCAKAPGATAIKRAAVKPSRDTTRPIVICRSLFTFQSVSIAYFKAIRSGERTKSQKLFSYPWKMRPAADEQPPVSRFPLAAGGRVQGCRCANRLSYDVLEVGRWPDRRRIRNRIRVPVSIGHQLQAPGGNLFRSRVRDPSWFETQISGFADVPAHRANASCVRAEMRRRRRLA